MAHPSGKRLATAGRGSLTLSLRVARRSVSRRLALQLALVGALLVVAPPSWHPWLGLLALGALAVAYIDLRGGVRVRVDVARGRLEMPPAPPVALAHIREVSVIEPHPDTPEIWALALGLADGRTLVPLHGPEAWVREARDFVQQARDEALRRDTERGGGARAGADTAPPPSAAAAAETATGGRGPSRPGSFDPEPGGDPLSLGVEIERRRRAGGAIDRVVCYVRRRDRGEVPPGLLPRGGYARALNALAAGREAAGFVRVDRARARERLEGTLGVELAYGRRAMSEGEARQFVDRFFAFFADDASFFIVPPGERLSEANFDEGLLAADDESVGLLWVESDNPGR